MKSHSGHKPELKILWNNVILPKFCLNRDKNPLSTITIDIENTINSKYYDINARSGSMQI